MGRLATWWVITVVAAALVVPSVSSAPSYAVPVQEPTADRTSGRTPAPSVGIRVGPSSTVALGQRVVFRGTVRHAAARSRVRLERRTAAGWRRVVVDRTNRFGRYDLRAVPPRGDTTFRVVLPRLSRQPQARSNRVTVRATWTPALALTRVSYDAAAGGGVVTQVAGVAPDLVGVHLQRQRRLADRTWADVGTTPVTADGSWADAVTGEAGWQLRWVCLLYTSPSPRD